MICGHRGRHLRGHRTSPLDGDLALYSSAKVENYNVFRKIYEMKDCKQSGTGKGNAIDQDWR